MVSVVIITKNEEKNIAKCLESVKWADEIVVIDDYSVDKTVDICKKYTRNIYQNKFINYSTQKKFAFLKASKDWILSIDADEIVPEKLKEEVEKVLSQKSLLYNGYNIPRKTFFLNKWIRHCGWYPDYQLRLFKNDSWSMKEVCVHESVQIAGKIGYLKEPILHYSYTSIFSYIDRMNKYTTLAAQQMLKDGVEIDVSKIKVLATKKARRTFWKMYIKQLGFMDGMRGLFLSFFSSTYQLMVYAKYWQMTDMGIKNEKT